MPLYHDKTKRLSSSHPLVTMCTPLPCAQGWLPVDAILLCGTALPSLSFVSDVSCRSQHLNGVSSAIKRCALAGLAFESPGWPSVAQKAGSTRAFGRDRRWALLLLRCARTDVPTYVLDTELDTEGGVASSYGHSMMQQHRPNDRLRRRRSPCHT